MIRQFEVTIEPGVTSSNPNETIVRLGKGVLSHVSIRPAPGPNWEVYIRFLHLESPVIPNDAEEWIPLEREKLDFYPNFDLWKEIYVIKVQLCSPQARYPHKIQIELTLAESESTEQLLSKLISEGL